MTNIDKALEAHGAACGGKGHIGVYYDYRCPVCNGTGKQPDVRDFESDEDFSWARGVVNNWSNKKKYYNSTGFPRPHYRSSAARAREGEGGDA